MPAVDDQHDAVGLARLVEFAQSFECVRQRVLHLSAVAVEAAHLLGELVAELPVGS
jgi:hypothetical protein